MHLEFDDGTLLLRDAPEDVPYAEWDDRVDEFRAQAYRYRSLLDWADEWQTDSSDDGQSTLQQSARRPHALDLEDGARSYPDLALTPTIQVDPRHYQQAALEAWRKHERRGSVVLPTGSGKTFLGLQAITDAGVATLVVVPTIDLMNQWHATLTNAFGDQLSNQHFDIGVVRTVLAARLRDGSDVGDESAKMVAYSVGFAVEKPQPSSVAGVGETWRDGRRGPVWWICGRWLRLDACVRVG